MDVLRERGITRTLEGIENLTIADLTAIRNDVSRRIEQKEGESPA
ncbi:MAG TPA: hypothetical protein VJC16_01970 [Candidatus Nanoarchaeia archaeon]|nr:hypothetical protein [Candidatus Nanoarchaeia archaeon]